MFRSSYECEKAIKIWANVIRGIAIAFMAICVFAAFVILCSDPEYLWWLALIIFFVGAITFVSSIFMIQFIWGFGDMVGNIRRLVDKDSNDVKNIMEEIDIEELPEL